MPKPRPTDPLKRWEIQVPSTVAAQIELRLVDPMRRKPRYGARSELIVMLLRQWLKDQQNR